MAQGRLYLIPVPITEGDPAETLPLSTLTVARSCKRFLAENAKSARSFLKSCGHPVAIAELEIIEIGHEPDPAKFSEWLSPVKDGTDTAIVSESGCPAVADPGAGLVKFAQTLGLEVVPFVGPSSILLTLMASGMNGQRFRFLGYLPVHEDERRQAILSLEKESRTTGETELFIETPYRNNRILEALATTLAADTRITRRQPTLRAAKSESKRLPRANGSKKAMNCPSCLRCLPCRPLLRKSSSEQGTKRRRTSR